MLSTTPWEAGRYRVLLVRVGKNTEEEKEAFCVRLWEKYGVGLHLLKKIVDRSPMVLKKGLSLDKAERLADIIASQGATVSIEKRWEGPVISVEFQDMAQPRVALEACALRKTTGGAWNVLGRARNLTKENQSDLWTLVQLFSDVDEFLAFEEVPLLINPLPPGEVAPFKAFFEGGLDVKRLSVAFKDASGRPLRAKDLTIRQDWVSAINGFRPGRDNGEDIGGSDLDCPVLEIHGKPDFRDGGEDMSEEVPAFLGMNEFLSSIEPAPCPANPPGQLERAEGLEEDHSEDRSATDHEPEIVLVDKGPAPQKEQESVPQEARWIAPQAVLAERVSGEDPALSAGIPLSSISLLPFSEVSGEPGTEGGSMKPLADEEHGGVGQPEEAGIQTDDGSVSISFASAFIELPPFSWIDEFRNAVEDDCRKPFSSFPLWLAEKREQGEFEDPCHRILTILLHARFDEPNLLEKALANTEKVYTLILKPDLALEEIPPLEGTRFFPGETWRVFFYRAISRLREIAGLVTARDAWDALELERLLQVIPHMSPGGSRMAARWIGELAGETVHVDFSRTLPVVTEDLFRVACRLGVTDPRGDQFRGPNSLGELKIQSFARTAFPSHPAKIEETMKRVGMEEQGRGHCLPQDPKCEGCPFENFCRKFYIHPNSTERGMSPSATDLL
jgi:hypothetical protein